MTLSVICSCGFSEYAPAPMTHRQRNIFAIALYLLMSMVLFNSTAARAQTDSATVFANQVQEMYVSYYGRPGDPAGVNFWVGKLTESNGDLTAIINQFGNSQEYNDRFLGLSNEQLVNNIFINLFGRNADPAGLDFYRGRLDSGALTLSSIALNISDGVMEGTDDFDIVANKINVATAYTAQVDEQSLSYGADELDAAIAIIAGVDSSQASVDAATTTINELTDGETDMELALWQEYYETNISAQIIQSQCINCHVSDGVASQTRLSYQPSNSANYQTTNFTTLRNFMDTVEGGGTLILDKARGVGHGGGVQLSTGSPAYENLSTFVGLVTGTSTSTGVPGKPFFDGISSISSAETLRRAAILLAGRLPTTGELASLNENDTATLSAALRGLMQGEGFHQFIIEGANDRLLTDKFIQRSQILDTGESYFPDYLEKSYQLALNNTVEEGWAWQSQVNFAVARAPLELIAYIIENERPYTEILTADYIMMNPYSNEVYRGGLSFADNTDFNDWKPATIQGYLRQDDSLVFEFDLELGGRVLSGGLETVYPHAGVLKSSSYLARYPTTATNRNRARSRWTNYHFLGFDIEKSAARTVDPVALADTNNPTMNNGACTVCHEAMDPVAGAFQNYGEKGFYRDQWGGLDSLPDTYKWPEQDSGSLYQYGDSWFRDMRDPGFKGETAPDNTRSLPWLASQMVMDPRFASAAIRFWWPAITGNESLTVPDENQDADFQARLRAFEAQNDFINEVADDLRVNYNLKDALVAILSSQWFRANATPSLSAERKIELAGVGAEKLLTPEQLDRKTKAITGFSWGESYPEWRGGHRWSELNNNLRLYYGGIDSDGLTTRSTELTALMYSVANKHAVAASCPIVIGEFSQPANSRFLFADLEKNDTPANASSKIRAVIVSLHEKLLGETLGSDDPEIDATYALFTESVEAKQTRNEWEHILGPGLSCDSEFEWEDGRDANGTLSGWRVVVTYLMADYRYIYE